MNTKLLISLLAGLLLAGGAVLAADVECAPIEMKDKECQGEDRHYPKVTINTETKEIHPEFVCTARESVIEFRVAPPGKTAVGAVSVKAKDSLNTWLIGTNYPDKKTIDVVVPEWVENNSVHHYNVIFEDGSCIDPRVHVED